MLFHRGFTVIELLVTVAVMVILAVMAVPSFSNMLAAQRLNDSAHELITVLSNARSQAVITQQSTQVLLSSGSSTSTLFYWQPSGGPTLKSGNTIIFAANGVVTNSDGTAKTGGADVVLCDSKNVKAVRVTISMLGNTTQTKESC